MSVAGISSTNALAQPSFFANFQQRRNDFQELSQALQSGDLDSAQAAFTDLSNLNQNSPLAQRFASSQIGKDFAAIGQALQSGDLDGAQQAFATFQQDVKTAFQQRFQGFQPQPTQQAQQTQATDQQSSVHHRHHHHHHSTNGDNDNSSSNGDSISITDASGDKIAINLGATSHNSDGGPEQVTLNFGAGSGPQQVTLNINGKENITLNFGAANNDAATTTQSTGSSQLNVTA